MFLSNGCSQIVKLFTIFLCIYGLVFRWKVVMNNTLYIALDTQMNNHLSSGSSVLRFVINNLLFISGEVMTVCKNRNVSFFFKAINYKYQLTVTEYHHSIHVELVSALLMHSASFRCFTIFPWDTTRTALMSWTVLCGFASTTVLIAAVPIISV